MRMIDTVHPNAIGHLALFREPAPTFEVPLFFPWEEAPVALAQPAPFDIPHIGNTNILRNTSRHFASLDDEDRAAAIAWEQAGNLVAPFVWAQHVEPALVSPNFYDYDLPTCERLLRIVRGRWLAAGFTRFDSVATYTPGTEFMRALKNMGVQYLMGMCAPTIVQD